jgi:hypothetical protein
MPKMRFFSVVSFVQQVFRSPQYIQYTLYFCVLQVGLPATVNVSVRRHKTGYSLYSYEDLSTTELVEDLGTVLDLYSDAWFGSIRAGD